MSSFLSDKAFRKHFTKRLARATGKKTNSVGTDYNRAMQAVNAVQGRMNKSTPQQAVVRSNPSMLGAKLDQAQRNRNREQSKTQVSKPTENQQAKKNSLGSKLYGG